MKRTKSLSFLAAFLSSLLILMLYYKDVPFFEKLDGSALDLMFELRGKRPTDPAIAIISIDEKSLKGLGRWPWPRRYWTELLDKIEKYGPRLLIFDVWFSEREAGSADSKLQRALKASNKAVLPIVFEMNDPTSAPEISQWGTARSLVSGSEALKEGKGAIAGLPEFNRAAKRLGHINVVPDYDGVVRWTPLLIRYKEHVFPSLALAASLELLSPKQISFAGGDGIRLDDLTILTDEANRMLINYNGPPKTYPYYSFIDVLQGRLGAEALKDKILFIGPTAQGIYDMRMTPFSSNTPGVEVNANIIDNLLHGSFLARNPLERLLDIIFILAAGVFFGLIIPRIRAVLTFPLAVTGVLAYAALTFYFFEHGRWISGVYPVLSMALSYLSSTAVCMFAGERKNLEIRKMFSNYVSREVVDELIRHPEKAQLGGQLKDVTIIFCDLKGFTGYSERHSPGEVVAMLNEFFEAMTECIIKYNGTLDKFLGDGLMAFWNAPIDQANHPELALRCALDMSRRFEDLHGKWSSESKELIDYGISVNAGEVIIGNIGVSGRKMEYTTIGDTVNITARLMEQSRIFNRKIITTKTCFDRVREIVDAEELGTIKLKGKVEPVTFLAVVGLKKQ